MTEQQTSRPSPPVSGRISFRIEGLCCAAEVRTLRDRVGPVVGGADHLAFDVVRGEMTVRKGAARASVDEIVEAVSETGMSARPVTDTAPEADGGETFWQRRGRTVLCVLSGALLLAGFTVHAVEVGGALGALEAESVPVAAMVLYLVATVSGAWFVAPRAAAAARALRPDMNLLMMVAVLGAIGIGEWLEAASVAFLFALALLLERWSVARARRAIESLLELSPDLARVVDPGSDTTTEIPVEEVSVGDLVRVRAGDRVPLDGEVVDGHSAVDQSAITGESVPVEKLPGDDVFAGTVNGTGTMDVRVTSAAADTTLARIIELVEEARARRSPSEQWVDRFARVYTPAMMALAVVMAVVPPLLLGDWSTWFYRALVLLVIACPCALVISTPVSMVAGLASSARAGVLVKGGRYLEAAADLEAVALDKTGTLTVGRPRVQRIVPVDGDHGEEELLAAAAALEAESNHPLAGAILAAAGAAEVDYRPAVSLRMLPGEGVEGEVEGRPMWIGSHRLMQERVRDSSRFDRDAEEIEDAGHSVIALGAGERVLGLIAVADELRPESVAAVAELRSLGIERLVLLTGDNDKTAAAVAAAVNVTEYRSELLPEDKVEAVTELRRRYGSVAMVGDGVNDAPALAASSLGIAMGAAGTDAAIETADVALMSDDLERLPWLVRHARRTLRVIRQNVVFALGIKVAFVALAAAGLATLWMAIAADMGASLLVIGNGLRLLR